MAGKLRIFLNASAGRLMYEKFHSIQRPVVYIRARSTIHTFHYHCRPIFVNLTLSLSEVYLFQCQLQILYLKLSYFCVCTQKCIINTYDITIHLLSIAAIK